MWVFFFIYRPKLGKTCSEIKLHSPKATSGSYVIDPDGEGGYEPFTVHCDMTDKNGNSSATEVNSVLQSVLNAFVLAQNARGKSFEESIRTISSGSTNHKFLVVVVSN